MLLTSSNTTFNKGLNMSSFNITNIGSNNFNLNTTLETLNAKSINLDSNGKLDYSHILNVPAIDNTITSDINMLNFNIINIGSNNYNLNSELVNINSNITSLNNKTLFTSL